MRPVVLLVGVGVLLTAAVVCGQDHAKDKKTQEQSKKSRESTNPKESPPPRAKAAGDKPAAKKSGKPQKGTGDDASPDEQGKPGEDSTESSKTDPDTTIREFDITCPGFHYSAKNPSEMCADPSTTQENNNAAEIAKSLDGALAGIRVKALNETKLLLFWKDKKAEPALPQLEALIRELSVRVPAVELDESRVIRLFNNRNASEIAEALSEEFTGVKVKPVGSDIIIIAGSDSSATQPISEMGRFVAQLDLPRPEVTLNAWSVQLSSKAPQKLEEDADVVRYEVSRYNDRLKRALDKGWSALSNDMVNDLKRSLFNDEETETRSFTSGEWFREYIGRIWIGCPDSASASDSAKCISERKLHGIKPCPPQRYCLGYHHAFDLSSPSLTRMLLILSAGDKPGEIATDVVNRMEEDSETPNSGLSAESARVCKPLKRKKPVKEKPPEVCLTFPHFREQLVDLARVERLGSLRAAYADFLFNYKWSVAYPHDFVPYYLTTSAAKLDSELAPFFTAFNRDIAEFLEQVQAQVRDELIVQGGRDKELYSSGLISVRAISGLQAEVDTKTANFFDATPPLTVNDLAKSLKDAESNLPEVAKANLGAHAGALVMAGLSAQRPAVAKVGRGLNLTVTPISLATASTAELKITLEANEDSDNGIIYKDKDQSKDVDDTSRVAQHKVDTSTRVDNMKLFEISAFSASLRRKGQSFPLLPPFVELPYLGSLLRVPLPSKPTYHRSFAIVNAVVVPTAADLAFGISFTGDRDDCSSFE